MCSTLMLTARNFRCSRHVTQGSPMTRDAESFAAADPDRRARQPRRPRVRVGAHAAAASRVSQRDDRRLVQGVHVGGRPPHSARQRRDRRRPVLGGSAAPATSARSGLSCAAMSRRPATSATTSRFSARRPGAPRPRSPPHGIPRAHRTGAPSQRRVSHRTCLPREDPGKPVLREQARLLAAARHRLRRSALSRSIARDSERCARDVARQLPARFVALHPFARRPRSLRPARPNGSSWRPRCRIAGCLCSGSGRRASSTSCGHRLAQPSGHLRRPLGDGSLGATAAALSLATLFVGPRLRPAARRRQRSACRSSASLRRDSPARTFPQGTGPSRMIHRPSPAGIDRGDDAARDRRASPNFRAMIDVTLFAASASS